MIEFAYTTARRARRKSPVAGVTKFNLNLVSPAGRPAEEGNFVARRKRPHCYHHRNLQTLSTPSPVLAAQAQNRSAAMLVQDSMLLAGVLVTQF